jgi:hypothetical protein
VFAFQRPAWWLRAMPEAGASLAASWLVSCALGAAALAWQRRGVGARARRATHARAPESLLAPRPGAFAALLWRPGWRGALTPGFASVGVGVGVAVGLAIGWTQPSRPLLPGAAWALMFSALLIALTERLQRALESHLRALAPWLASLPGSTAWRWQARVLVCLPMAVAGAVAVALVLASRPWRAAPLAAFALGLVATPVAMACVPTANREGHVGLWAVCTGLLTAFGSELWN